MEGRGCGDGTVYCSSSHLCWPGTVWSKGQQLRLAWYGTVPHVFGSRGLLVPCYLFAM
jgi:hypothetical protein